MATRVRQRGRAQAVAFRPAEHIGVAATPPDIADDATQCSVSGSASSRWGHGLEVYGKAPLADG